jgi:hypothetical protein
MATKKDEEAAKGINSTDLQIAWAKIIARAAVDNSFCKVLRDNPVSVFKEYGFTVPKGFDVNKDISPPLDETLSSIAMQRAQAAAQPSGPIGATAAYSMGSASGACLASAPGSGQGSQGSLCVGTVASADCAGGGAAGSQRYGSPAAGATLGTFGTYCGATAGTAGTAGAAPGGPVSGGCWGSAGTVGSAGTFGGSAGSVGSAGSYGSAGGAASTQLYGNPAAGATLGSVGTYCGASAGTD